MYNLPLLIWRLSKRNTSFSSNCGWIKQHFSMQGGVERFQIIILAVKSSTHTSCMTKQAMSTRGQRSTSFLEGCSGASLSVVTGKVYTPIPHEVLKIDSQSLNVWIRTYISFGISKAVTATFTNVLVTLQKHLYKTVTSKTSIMNLFMSVCIYKQQKEPDASRKI